MKLQVAASAAVMITALAIAGSILPLELAAERTVPSGRGFHASGDTVSARIFQTRCAACHGESAEYAPPLRALAARPPEAIITSLTAGSMRDMAAGLNAAEIRALAVYLSDHEPAREGAGVELAQREGAYCSETRAPISFGMQFPFEQSQPQWNGWGRDHEGSRYQPEPGFTAGEVSRLRVKWAFGYEGGGAVSQPTIIGDVVFVGGRHVHALDAESGCIYWTYDPGPRGARAAISVGPFPGGRTAAYIGDRNRVVHALDASTGELLWRTQVDEHPRSQITGAPLLRGGRLYVPLSSGEESAAGAPAYECCTFRGNVTAVDSYTGDVLWKTHVIEEEPAPYRINELGRPMHGPAGAAIWSAPTFDLRRNVVYAATGNSYTEVNESGSDAVVAFDARTGALLWRNQVTEDDNYVVGCFGRVTEERTVHHNCPEELGPDYDFGSSPVLRTLPDGRQVLLAGQKSGIMWAMDPDADGAIIWKRRVGVGGALGGIQWGFAADDEVVYVANSDVGDFPWREEEPRPGLTAIRIATGEEIWHAPAPAPECSWTERDCSNALSAPVTLIPGVVFAGSLDGRLRAFSAKDGSVIWSFDTARDWETVNGVEARGGSLNATGPAIAGGRLFMNSGYGSFGTQPGNVLLMFTVDGR